MTNKTPKVKEDFNSAANNTRRSANSTTNNGSSGIVTAAEYQRQKNKLATPRPQLILRPDKNTAATGNKIEDDKVRNQVERMGNRLNNSSRELRRNFKESSRKR